LKLIVLKDDTNNKKCRGEYYRYKIDTTRRGKPDLTYFFRKMIKNRLYMYRQQLTFVK